MKKTRRCEQCNDKIGPNDDSSTCEECGAEVCEGCYVRSCGVCQDCYDLYFEDDEEDEDEPVVKRCDHYLRPPMGKERLAWVAGFDPRYERCARCGEVRKAEQAVAS